MFVTVFFCLCDMVEVYVHTEAIFYVMNKNVYCCIMLTNKMHFLN